MCVMSATNVTVTFSFQHAKKSLWATNTKHADYNQ